MGRQTRCAKFRSRLPTVHALPTTRKLQDFGSITGLMKVLWPTRPWWVALIVVFGGRYGVPELPGYSTRCGQVFQECGAPCRTPALAAVVPAQQARGFARNAQRALRRRLRSHSGFLVRLPSQHPHSSVDAALLALGWAGALRRSELVGLDWQQLGSGGLVTVSELDFTITPMASKASRDEGETIVLPRADMPTACARLEAWALLAGLQPGEPVFRSVDQLQVIAAERLTDCSVSRIVKARVRKHIRANGRSTATCPTSRRGRRLTVHRLLRRRQMSHFR